MPLSATSLPRSGYSKTTRARAFYARNGFQPDVVSRIEDGVTDIRLVR